MVLGSGMEQLVENSKSLIPVRIKEFISISDIGNKDSDVANISMAIQKGKYDGTKESFDKYTDEIYKK